MDWDGRRYEAELHEQAVEERIRQLGFTVDRFGQGLLSETVRGYLSLETRSLLRWLPDLAVMVDHARIIVLVDAKNCAPSNRGTLNHSIEMRSLRTAQLIDLPVWYVCQDFKALSAHAIIRDGPDESCCQRCWKQLTELPDDLPERCPEHQLKGRNGSSTPYVLIAKARCRTLKKVFFHPPAASS